MNTSVDLQPRGAMFAGLLLALVLSPLVIVSPAQAGPSGARMASFAASPVDVAESVPPVVMLTMSMDHQYFFKAYNDYTDLTGDGDVERTYDDSFDYYGYFHSRRCYRYDDAQGRFNPVGLATGPNTHHCTAALDDAWSGNFLNWASMTRMDVVRKILYGGYRSSDTASLTVLERAHLPSDAHAFVKYYNGDDINSLVPSGYGSIKVDGANGGNPNKVDDADEGISICNVSFASSGTSQGTNEAPAQAPLMRFVRKNYQLWTANEVRQCTWRDEYGIQSNGNRPENSGINAASSDPPDTDALRTPAGARDHIARVSTCVAAFHDSADNRENCRAYGDNLKPEGLLQRYGLDGTVRFGLVTGSYQKNLSGGVLRKAAGVMSDEVSATDGTFIARTGATPGIIRTLNAVRIYGYSYAQGNYLGADDNCGFQQTSFTEGTCKSWGNPVSEIYLESLRYLALSNERSPTSAFNADDSRLIPGLVQDNWSKAPLDANNYCASLSALVFNASVSSYDEDQTTFGSVNGKALTAKVGDGEGITGGRYFIGRTASQTDEICTPKTIAGLGDALGLCPEAPTLTGSYHLAGLAHYARTTDLRPDAAFPKDQSVRTFAVSLATSTPVIEAHLGDPSTATPLAPVPKVRILPAYRLRAGGNNTDESLNTPSRDGAGSMVDFKVITPHTMVAGPGSVNPAPAGSSTGHYYAKFWMNWEDSEQGGDFDQDSWGTYEYRVNTNVKPATVAVTTNMVSGIGGGFRQLFGFVISGTTQDGFHAYSGTQGGGTDGANFTDPTGVKGCRNCQALNGTGGGRSPQVGPQSHTFSVREGGAEGLLESPLYYAAKWGGFDDLDGDGTPNLQLEWDVKNTNGEFVDGGDGIPDNYFFVTNPSALEDSLTTILNAILERVSAGSAAAVLANDRKGNGAIFQATYEPSKRDFTESRNEVRWIGNLYSLWLDNAGYLREDAGQKGRLEGYNTDPRVELFFDEITRRTRIKRYSSKNDLEFEESAFVVRELNSLQPIWSASERLADLSDESITRQRTYTAPAESGRHILTWLDTDLDGVADTNEQVPFIADSFSGNRHMWLDTDTPEAGARLVEWTRGRHQGMGEFRSRLLDYAGDGSTITAGGHPEVMRLADIIHSAPVAVAAPSEGFDFALGDSSYAKFRERYRNRRQVIYAGSNGGMIHAFNAGFHDATAKAFTLSGKNSEVAHPLGSELWAYVPRNLLPHLQWAARKDYSHVYYVDGAATAYDVKIFGSGDQDHPGGWGTILVVGMGYGGGSDENGIVVDSAKDGLAGANSDGNPQDDVRTKSAIVILDVTNPEVPPRLLAELSPPNLQYTKSTPHPVVVNGGSSSGKWFLVMGSGPSDQASASYRSGGSRFAEVFVYDLTRLGEGAGGLVRKLALPSTGTPPRNTDVFIGDITGVDFDFDYSSDALYFGTVGAATDDPAINQGALYRVLLNGSTDPAAWSQPFTLLSGVNQPFSRAPTLQLDERRNRWVVAASGRFEVDADRGTKARQTLYGFLDPPLRASRAASSLVNVSDAVVTSSGIRLTADGQATVVDRGTLTARILDAGGWRRDFSHGPGGPAQRGVRGVAAENGLLLVPAYTPDTALCTAEGKSTLLGLSLATGTATAEGVFGSIPCAICEDPTDLEMPPSPMVENVLNPGTYQIQEYEGLMDLPSLVSRQAENMTGQINGRACATSSTAAQICENARLEDAVFSGEISWRERKSDE
ncbi:MAG: hypothetical protein RL434_598 [Pseudomonadota bacterium]